jgi:hypothetical protein
MANRGRKEITSILNKWHNDPDFKDQWDIANITEQERVFAMIARDIIPFSSCDKKLKIAYMKYKAEHIALFNKMYQCPNMFKMSPENIMKWNRYCMVIDDYAAGFEKFYLRK